MRKRRRLNGRLRIGRQFILWVVFQIWEEMAYGTSLVLSRTDIKRPTSFSSERRTQEARNNPKMILSNSLLIIMAR